jgi:hypothetical protein
VRVMGKKIEREFWVSDLTEFLLENNRYAIEVFLFSESDEEHQCKITISFEVPEKKITISESEVREILKMSALNKEAHEAFVRHFFGGES